MSHYNLAFFLSAFLMIFTYGSFDVLIRFEWVEILLYTKIAPELHVDLNDDWILIFSKYKG